MTAAPAANAVIPAQLGFLAIFNPSLGYTDETVEDQIVYYASVTTQSTSHKRRRARGRPTDDISQEERNERLRQIGLAQGMASFGRGFANGASVDSIDTEKSRLVLHELEPGWWILASVDLTKIPLPPRLPSKTGEKQEERYEHSTKEIKPAGLLLRDLLRAHSIFLMHHGSSLSALFVRSKRKRFVAVLSRYWDLFLSTWTVMLSGNPIRDVYGGINIATSGELGVGVGEEDRGSGEREVLEGLVGRIEGLVDLVVSKFGEYDPDTEPNEKEEQWLGTGQEPRPEDGAIFLGTGALSRKSLRDVTHWMEDLYTWGEHAYGVIDSPTSLRRANGKRARKASEPATKGERPSETAATPGTQQNADGEQREESLASSKDQDQSRQEGGLERMVGYLKLGYGTYWSLPGGPSDAAPKATTSIATEQGISKSTEQDKLRPAMPQRTPSQEGAGYFLIGLKGDIEETSDGDASHDSDEPAGAVADVEHNSRTLLRTINLELESEAQGRPEATIVRDFEHPASILTQSQVVGNMLPGYDSHDLNKASKLRVVVYVNKPFIFTFMFELRTDSLAWDALYRSLHYQLAPLRKPLLASTRYRPERPNVGPVASSIHELIWDPEALTIYCTIPNVPEQYTPADSWSRADAISTHLHLLNIHGSTRSPKNTDLERTQKTGRGWWIVWARMFESKTQQQQRRVDAAGSNLDTIQESDDAGVRGTEDGSDHGNDEEDRAPAVNKEVFLIRCASDHARFRGVSGSYTESGAGGAEGAGRLVQGIGVDTRRYVEELLNLL